RSPSRHHSDPGATMDRMPSRVFSAALMLAALFASTLASAATTRGRFAKAGSTHKASAAKPVYGTAGFDDAGRDRSTRPGDDFFRFANGGWIDRTPIPADLPTYSLRRAMTDSVERRLH